MRVENNGSNTWYITDGVILEHRSTLEMIHELTCIICSESRLKIQNQIIYTYSLMKNIKKIQGNEYLKRIKFRKGGKNHENPIKIKVFSVYLKKYWKFWKMIQTNVVALIKIHILCLINFFGTINRFRKIR